MGSVDAAIAAPRGRRTMRTTTTAAPSSPLAGRRRLLAAALAVFIAVAGANALPVAAAAAVEETRLVAVDIGTGWVKTATLDFSLSPDSPPAAAVDMLLSEQSNRKTPPCISFRCTPSRTAAASPEAEVEVEAGSDGWTCERAFAEQALALSLRFPQQVVCSHATLLGAAPAEAVSAATDAAGILDAGHVRQLSASAAADEFLFNTTTDAGRGGFRVFLPRSAVAAAAAAGGFSFSPEELTGMLFGNIAETARKRDAAKNGLPRDAGDAAVPAAERVAAPVVRHAAATVPSFSSVAERQAIVDAGAAGGLRVVRLVHSVTAAAAALAHYREEHIFATATPSYAMIFDMGTRQAEAAVFSFTPRPAAAGQQQQQQQRRGLLGRVALVGMATNRTLGGAAFDQCIAEYWDRTFLGGRILGRTQQKGAGAGAGGESRKQRAAMLRAANMARERLSANREAPVTVEGVHGGHNGGGGDGPFTTALSRGTFEQVCEGLFQSAVAVRDAALAAAADADPLAPRTAAQLARFEVVGGATRMPRLLALLGQGYRAAGAVDRTLNGDEAVAVGAAYLGGAAAGMLPAKIAVQEALTNDIGAFVITPPPPAAEKEGDGGGARFGVLPVLPGGGDAAVPLFPAKTTDLPAIQSVVLDDVAEDVLVALAAPPQLAGALLERAAAAAGGGGAEGPAVCPGCFLAYAHIGGVGAALDRAARAARVQSLDNLTSVVLDAASVVVEAAVSESGLPLVRKAYLRAAFTKTITHAQQQQQEKTEAATPEAGDDDNTGEEGKKQEQQQQQQQQQRADEDGDGDGEVLDAEAVDEEEDEKERRKGAEKPEGEAAAAAQVAAPTQTVTAFTRAIPLSTRSVVAGAGPADAAGPRVLRALQHLPRGSGLTPAELDAARATLRRLHRADAYRYACSDLRNTMEGALIALRTHDAYYAERDVDAAMLPPALRDGDEAAEARADVLRWRDVVREISDWLDDDGETASRQTLAEKSARVMRLKKNVLPILDKRN